MSNTAVAFKNVLSCPICFETLNDPKILTCGHSFCLKPCLAEIVKTHEPICPLCRTPITLPTSGEIEDLPTNFCVTGLLDVLENTESSTLQTSLSHIQGVGDYVCETCLLQLCSCCHLSFHVDNNHVCTTVSEFTEKLQQDVSKMVAVINEPPWSEDTERYTKDSLLMPKYCNLQEKINTSCEEMLLSLNDEKLDLKKTKQLQKLVRKDYSKFRQVCEEIEQEIRKEKNLEDITEKLKLHQIQLTGLDLPNSIYKKPAFCLKTSGFKNRKEKAETLSKALMEQLNTKPSDILAMDAKLREINENVEEIKQYMKDVMADYHTFLLKQACVKGESIELRHLLQISEEIEMMNFGSDRHSEIIISTCSELICKFETIKPSLRGSCTAHVGKHRSIRGVPFANITKQDFVKILVGMENCKAYYEDVYDIIGKHFVYYDNNVMKTYVEKYMSKQESYVFSLEGKSDFIKKHLTKFENFIETTTIHCKALIRENSKGKIFARVFHEKLKAIEMRIETSDYHYKLLDNLLSMELECYKIKEEFQSFVPTKYILGKDFQICFENKREVLRLWESVLRHDTICISLDVEVMKTVSKIMKEKLEKVACLHMLPDSEVNGLITKTSKLLQIIGLCKQMKSAVPEVSAFICYPSEQVHILSMIFKNASHPRSWSLSELLLIRINSEIPQILIDDILSNFQFECIRVYQLASVKRNNLLHRASGLLLQHFVSSRKIAEWNIPDLTQESKDQWKAVSEMVSTLDFDADLLESRFNRAMKLHYEVINVSTKMNFECLKIVLVLMLKSLLVCGLVLAVVGTGSICYLYWFVG